MSFLIDAMRFSAMEGAHALSFNWLSCEPAYTMSALWGTMHVNRSLEANHCCASSWHSHLQALRRTISGAQAATAVTVQRFRGPLWSLRLLPIGRYCWKMGS